MNKYYLNLDKNGYSKVKIPKYLISKIRKAVLYNINQKFPAKELKSYNGLIRLLDKTSEKNFIKHFGSNLSRILNAKCTKVINTWVEQNIPDKINCRRAALNLVTQSECKNNKNLIKKQFSAFYRVVRKNKKDVGHPHRDSSFWKIGNIRHTYFKHIIVWKLWIPVFGVNKQNTLNMVNSSHKDNIKISYVKKNGLSKPKISKSYITNNISRVIKPIKSDGSEGLLFHQDMVHFAQMNKSSNCRISIEFNILAR